MFICLVCAQWTIHPDHDQTFDRDLDYGKILPQPVPGPSTNHRRVRTDR